MVVTFAWTCEGDGGHTKTIRKSLDSVKMLEYPDSVKFELKENLKCWTPRSNALLQG